jgi:uncharacterized membrane protein
MLPEILPNWHPIFVHFTIALFGIATMLLILGSFANLKYREILLNTAFINLWLGCIFTIGTLLAGWYAYNTVAHDEPSHAAMTDHKNWAIPTAILFWLIGIWAIKLYKNNNKSNKLFIVSMIIASSFLGVTGWKGGEVVYRFGLGVMSLPNTDSHAHGAAEAAGSEGHGQHMEGTNEKDKNTLNPEKHSLDHNNDNKEKNISHDGKNQHAH